MFGATLGDIIGSRFEFDRGNHTKEFQLFTKRCSFTDDTVMTVAVAKTLLETDRNASEEELKKALIVNMQKLGRRYPYAGYGSRFIHWVFAKEPRPYNSWGNGSAMRVSAAGWLYDSLERTREVARWTAEVSHNHPEGIKGAECAAAVIYLARTGSTKEEIREYVIKEFDYDLHESLEELRKRHRHDESCMDSLPKALVSFLEGNSYEDVIRNAVSLGGDTDTLGAIAGGMAEGYYEIPEEMIKQGKEYLTEELKEILCMIDTGRTDE
ncbi:MAG: ADP-ribosylglycohydrolase family protein [Erysipelotrichaceae bacterium]|nr:ADP-ribosylglycohydrolase family protein [Erysipelotrichaceae bacterium]